MVNHNKSISFVKPLFHTKYIITSDIMKYQLSHISYSLNEKHNATPPTHMETKFDTHACNSSQVKFLCMPCRLIGEWRYSSTQS